MSELSEDIQKAILVCDAISSGDFEARVIGIDKESEFSPLYDAINRMIDRADAYVRESTAAMDYVAHKKYYRKILLGGMPGAYASASTVINDAVASMGEVHGKSIGLGNTVNGLASIVKEKSDEISDAAANSSTKVDAATTRSLEVSEAASRSHENVQTVATATEELSVSGREIARQVGISSESVKKSLTQSEETNTQMESLAEAAKKINSVVDRLPRLPGKQTYWP